MDAGERLVASQPRLKALLRMMLAPCGGDVQDVLQKTNAAIISGMSRIPEGTPPEKYFAGVAVNQAKMHLRSLRRAKADYDTANLVDPVGESSTPESALCPLLQSGMSAMGVTRRTFFKGCIVGGATTATGCLRLDTRKKERTARLRIGILADTHLGTTC